jgi:HEAT repeat protein
MKHLKKIKAFLIVLALGIGTIANLQPISAQNSSNKCSDSQIDFYISESVARLLDLPSSESEVKELSQELINSYSGAIVVSRGSINPKPLKCNPNELPALITALKNPNKDIRYRGAFAIAQTGKDAKSAIPDLTTALKDTNEDVSYIASMALERIGKDAVKSLVSVLIDTNEYGSRQATEALKGIGKDAKDSIPDLISALKHPRKFVRINAAVVLGVISIKDALPTLFNALKDSDQEIRSHTLYELGEIGKNAKSEILPILLVTLKDPSEDIRYRAASALNEIVDKDDKYLIPNLIEALRDPEISVRYRISPALVKIGKDAVPALIHTLKDSSDRDICYTTAEILERIGKDAVPALLYLLKDPDYNVRAIAEGILKRIDPSLILK